LFTYTAGFQNLVCITIYTELLVGIARLNSMSAKQLEDLVFGVIGGLEKLFLVLEGG